MKEREGRGGRNSFSQNVLGLFHGPKVHYVRLCLCGFCVVIICFRFFCWCIFTVVMIYIAFNYLEGKTLFNSV